MRILVDTSVWSLILRRDPATPNPTEQTVVRELRDVVQDGRARIIGTIRQELLSGIKTDRQFELLQEKSALFEYEELTTADYENAAAATNRCFRAGLTASSVDALICAIALNRNWAILTTDSDFDRFQPVLRFTLHKPTVL